MASPFSGPWVVNGSAPRVQFLPQPQVRRVAGDAGLARAGDHGRAWSSRSRRTVRRGRPRAARTRSAASRRPGPPRPPPAPRSRSWRWPGRGGSPGRGGRSASMTARWMSTPIRCLPLCEPDTFACLVLDPHPARGGEAQRLAQFPAAEERRGAEPAAVDGGDRRVERGHQVAVAGVGHARGPWPRGGSA